MTTKTAVRRSSKPAIIETFVSEGEIVQEPLENHESAIHGRGNENVGDGVSENILPIEEIRENEKDISAQDMLRQARSAAASVKQQDATENVPKPESPEIPENEAESSRASSYLETARKEAALKVIGATEQAQLARLQDGIKAGIADIEDFNKGREIGRLLALAESTNIHSGQLSQQLEQVRSHTDVQTAQVVQLALKGLGFDMSGNSPGELLNPLEGTVLAGLLGSSKATQGFRIIETE